MNATDKQRGRCVRSAGKTRRSRAKEPDRARCAPEGGRELPTRGDWRTCNTKRGLGGRDRKKIL